MSSWRLRRLRRPCRAAAATAVKKKMDQVLEFFFNCKRKLRWSDHKGAARRKKVVLQSPKRRRKFAVDKKTFCSQKKLVPGPKHTQVMQPRLRMLSSQILETTTFEDA